RFAVLRVRTKPSIESSVAEDVLCGSGLVALYAPGEYEVLIERADREHAEGIASEIAAELGESEVRIGIAVYPADGRSEDALLGQAAGTGGLEDEPIVLDPAMRDLYRIGERVAQGTISVLILGETGVGKEVFAEALHKTSPRSEARFVRINCAALAETL